jgi:hypothetical protein
MGAAGHLQFYRGIITETPGPTFYPVAVSLRVTPWFLASAVIAGCAVCVFHRTRATALVVACAGLPIVVELGLASKQFDRYGFALVALAAVVIGVATGELVLRQRTRGP